MRLEDGRFRMEGRAYLVRGAAIVVGSLAAGILLAALGGALALVH